MHEDEIKRKKAKHAASQKNMMWARQATLKDSEKRDPEADKQALDAVVNAYNN